MEEFIFKLLCNRVCCWSHVLCRAVSSHLDPTQLLQFTHSLCTRSIELQADGSHLARFIRIVIDSTTAFISAQLEELQAMHAVSSEKTPLRKNTELSVREAMKLLADLLRLRQQSLLEQFRELDSFPSHPVFDKARAILAPLKQQQTLRMLFCVAFNMRHCVSAHKCILSHKRILTARFNVALSKALPQC